MKKFLVSFSLLVLFNSNAFADVCEGKAADAAWDLMMTNSHTFNASQLAKNPKKITGPIIVSHEVISYEFAGVDIAGKVLVSGYKIILDEKDCTVTKFILKR